MDVPRVRTPPILDWLVVSLSGSSDEDVSDDDFPFETISAAVEKLKNVAYNDWTYQSSEGFEIKRRSVGFDESLFGGNRDRNSLEYICPEIKKNLKSIVQDYNENLDYLEQFSMLSAFYDKIQDELGR